MKILHEHLAELNRQQKKKEFAEIKQTLEARERILTYFDKEEEIELEIQRKVKEDKKIMRRIKGKLKKVEEDYTPPEITKRRGTV